MAIVAERSLPPYSSSTSGGGGVVVVAEETRSVGSEAARSLPAAAASAATGINDYVIGGIAVSALAPPSTETTATTSAAHTSSPCITADERKGKEKAAVSLDERESTVVAEIDADVLFLLPCGTPVPFDPCSHDTFLLDCIRKGHSSCVRALHARVGEVGAQRIFTNHVGGLMRSGDTAGLHSALQLKTRVTSTALLEAQQRGDIDLHAIRLLLRMGAAVDAVNAAGETPLHLAATPAMTALLLHHGADPCGISQRLFRDTNSLSQHEAATIAHFRRPTHSPICELCSCSDSDGDSDKEDSEESSAAEDEEHEHEPQQHQHQHQQHQQQIESRDGQSVSSVGYKQHARTKRPRSCKHQQEQHVVDQRYTNHADHVDSDHPHQHDRRRRRHHSHPQRHDDRIPSQDLNHHYLEATFDNQQAVTNSLNHGRPDISSLVSPLVVAMRRLDVEQVRILLAHGARPWVGGDVIASGRIVCSDEPASSSSSSSSSSSFASVLSSDCAASNSAAASQSRRRSSDPITQRALLKMITCLLRANLQASERCASQENLPMAYRGVTDASSTSSAPSASPALPTPAGSVAIQPVHEQQQQQQVQDQTVPEHVLPQLSSRWRRKPITEEEAAKLAIPTVRSLKEMMRTFIRSQYSEPEIRRNFRHRLTADMIEYLCGGQFACELCGYPVVDV